MRAVQAHLVIEDIVVNVLDLLQQAIVNLAHGASGDQCRTVFFGQRFGRAAVVVPCPLAFKAHQGAEVDINDAVE